PDLSLSAARVERRSFRHWPDDLAVRIHVIEENQLCVGSFACFDRVVHDAGPQVSPDPQVVLQANQQVDNVRPRYGADGLIQVGKIGRNDLVCATSALWISAYQADMKSLFGKVANQFDAYGAACAHYGVHTVKIRQMEDRES